MEKIEFKLDGPSVIGPRRGCILLARFQLVGRQQELGSIFCDYGMLAGRSLHSSIAGPRPFSWIARSPVITP